MPLLAVGYRLAEEGVVGLPGSRPLQAGDDDLVGTEPIGKPRGQGPGQIVDAAAVTWSPQTARARDAEMFGRGAVEHQFICARIEVLVQPLGAIGGRAQ